ncbi:MAG: aminotransferase class V-fold PLP-dependent enzyme [Romboutsia timonensis]|nr:aminotransferase class V-fold PLP-dependent enzyme [Romboutsia timonensis]
MSSSSNKKRTIGEKNLDYRKIFLGVDVKFKLENGKKLIPIGFDNGATTPALKCVFDEVYNNLLIYGSIGRGQGPKGELSTRKYEESRDKMLKFFNLQDTNTHTVIYTKTTTESLNILANILIKNKNDKVLTTRMEHHANDLPWRKNATVEYVDVDELGRIKIEDIENKLKKENGNIKIVSVTGASNVTGYINPIHEIARLAHKYGAIIVVDGAQLVAHKEVDMKGKDPSEQIDFLVFSAHKIYAPFGSGVIVGLIKYLDVKEPFVKGGGCVDYVFDDNVIWSEPPSLHEAGSPNFIGAMAMVRALEELKKIGFENIYNHERKIKDYLIEEMKKIDNVIIYGDTENTEDRLGVISFNIKNKDCYKVADIFAKESAVSLRAGKFCAHPYVARLLKVSNSYEEYEKNLDDADFGMVRLSIGLYNTMEEAKIFIDELKRIALDIY